MADKKSGPTADDIMSSAEMKPLLIRSKQEPISCVIGLTKAKDGVVLLHMKTKPKQLVAEMKKRAAKANLELDAQSLRFGRAHVDTEAEAGSVKFVVNKDASGAMRTKLLEHLKKAGFSKLDIEVDTGLEAEPDDASETTASAAPAAASPPPPLPSADATTASPPPTAAAPPTAAGLAADGRAEAGSTATLTRELTDLVKAMIPVMTSDPSRGTGLKTLAAQAQASLKAGDLQRTTVGIEALRRALNGAAAPTATAQPPTPQGATAPAAPEVHAKSRLVWLATRKKVESELGKLKQGIIAACNGQDIEAALEDAFRKRVEPVLGSLDEGLAQKLDEVNKTTDPAQRTKLLSEAKQILQRYQAYVANEPIMAQLDTNPFVPLAVQKTLMATLSALSSTLR